MANITGYSAPLCGDHAASWFTERNHLSGGMEATCVVCAHRPAILNSQMVLDTEHLLRHIKEVCELRRAPVFVGIDQWLKQYGSQL